MEIPATRCGALLVFVGPNCPLCRPALHVARRAMRRFGRLSGKRLELVPVDLGDPLTDQERALKMKYHGEAMEREGSAGAQSVLVTHGISTMASSKLAHQGGGISARLAQWRLNFRDDVPVVALCAAERRVGPDLKVLFRPQAPKPGESATTKVSERILVQQLFRAF